MSLLQEFDKLIWLVLQIYSHEECFNSQNLLVLVYFISYTVFPVDSISAAMFA